MPNANLHGLHPKVVGRLYSQQTAAALLMAYRHHTEKLIHHFKAQNPPRGKIGDYSHPVSMSRYRPLQGPAHHAKGMPDQQSEGSRVHYDP